MKFNSQICTTREQSERLLALGLKVETADMFYAALHKGTKVVGYRISPVYNDEQFEIFTDDIPAWSLNRLIEMMPLDVVPEGGFDNIFTLTKGYPSGYSVEYAEARYDLDYCGNVKDIISYLKSLM